MITPTLDEITYSLDQVNKTFDECNWGIAPVEDSPGRPVNDGLGNSLSSTDVLDIQVNIVPNPFVSSTKINFSTNQDISNLTVEVFNMMGVKVTSLFNGSVHADHQNTVTFTASGNQNQGIYLLVLKTEKETSPGG